MIIMIMATVETMIATVVETPTTSSLMPDGASMPTVGFSIEGIGTLVTSVTTAGKNLEQYN